MKLDTEPLDNVAIPTPVAFEPRLVDPTGVHPPRPLTRADLHTMGWWDRDDVYDRREHMFELILGEDKYRLLDGPLADTDTDDRWTFVRWIIEYFAYYMKHDPDPEHLARFRSLIESGTLPE